MSLGEGCLKGGRAYSAKEEPCLGGNHGNQASANHPKKTSDPSAWRPEGPGEWEPWDLQDPQHPKHPLKLDEKNEQVYLT